MEHGFNKQFLYFLKMKEAAQTEYEKETFEKCIQMLLTIWKSHLEIGETAIVEISKNLEEVIRSVTKQVSGGN